MLSRSMLAFLRLALLASVLYLFAAVSSQSLSAPHRGSSADFSIAFHILVAPGDEPLLDRFLSQLYHPSNTYLVEFQDTAAYVTSADRPSLAHDFENIHYRAADIAVVGGVSEVLCTLSAMAFFVDQQDVTGRPFHYYLNTSPREYPTLTPHNLRFLLRSAHQASRPPLSFFHFAPEHTWAHYQSRIDKLYYDPSVVFSIDKSGARNSARLIEADVWNPDRAHRNRRFPLADSAMILSADLVRLCTDSMLSKHILLLFSESNMAVEHFFASLASDTASAVVGRSITSTALRCPDLQTLAGDPASYDTQGPGAANTFRRYRESLSSNQDEHVVMNSACILVRLPPSNRASDNAGRDLLDAAILSEQGVMGTSNSSVFLTELYRYVHAEIAHVIGSHSDSDADLTESMLHKQPL